MGNCNGFIQDSVADQSKTSRPQSQSVAHHLVPIEIVVGDGRQQGATHEFSWPKTSRPQKAAGRLFDTAACSPSAETVSWPHFQNQAAAPRAAIRKGAPMSESAPRPFSIRIFVPNGDPDGLRLVEKSNWSGIGVVFNRSNYRQVVRRAEFDRTGTYVLIGSSDDSALPLIYIGEGDPVRDRLNSHYVRRDFWDWAVFFVSKDSSLNKAHVQRIEWRLIELAKAAKQCRLDNVVSPSPPTLSEADTADVDSFVLDMLSIFPLLGLSVFEKAEGRSKPHEVLSLEARGVKATGYEDPKGFVVCEGSELVKVETPTIHQYMSTLRKDLLKEGVVMESGDRYRFVQDHIFGSPSTAAGVILGRTANGRVEWKTREGRTLKEVQTQATVENGGEG
jgi:hypothetical protein